MTDDDLVCPDCGGPIGTTSTYCMHCSADLTDRRDPANGDGGSAWGEAAVDAVVTDDEAIHDAADVDGEVEPLDDSPENTDDLPSSLRSSSSGMEQGRLYPPGFLYNTLWIVAALVGGVGIGLGCTLAASLVAGSSVSMPLGFLAWLGSTYGLLQWRPV